MEGQRFLLLINTQLLKRGINEIEILIFGSGAVWLETGEALNYRTEERTGVVVATGSSPVIVKKRKSTTSPRLGDFAGDPVASTTPSGLPAWGTPVRSSVL